MATITYNYTYGTASGPNRQIQFARTGQDPRTIQAHVYVLQGAQVGPYITTVPGNSITVEMESTTSKMNALVTGRGLQPNVLLSNLTVDQQNGIQFFSWQKN